MSKDETTREENPDRLWEIIWQLQDELDYYRQLKKILREIIK